MANMIDRIATIYGYSPTDHDRRNATALYSVGYFACRYYETKRSAPTKLAV